MTVKNGQLPKGWWEVRLNNVASIKTGPFGTQLHQRDYVQSNGTPIVTVEHLSESGLIHKNLPLVSHHDKQRLRQYLIQEGDIVFSRVGSVDRSALVSEDEDGWLFSGRLLRVRPKKCDVYSPYLNYFFHTRKFRHHMKSIAVGGTMPSINTSILSNVIIHLPSMDQQKAIASLLEKWDTVIEKTEALIEAKEKRFKWLVKLLISKIHNSKYGRVSSITKEVSNRNQDGGVERVLSVTNHSGFVLPEDQFEHRVASADLSNYKIVSHGQYAYNPSRINVGSIARLDDWDVGVLSPMYVVFKLDKKKVNSDYFLHWLSLEETRQRIKSSAQGSVRETVSFGNFGAIPVPLPSLEVQTHIAKTLNAAKGEIYLLRQLAEQYRTQKRGLMQKLLTGKWRLKID